MSEGVFTTYDYTYNGNGDCVIDVTQSEGFKCPMDYSSNSGAEIKNLSNQLNTRIKKYTTLSRQVRSLCGPNKA
ncbi:hypothetical protein QTN25_000269 [Entamoeba marina]